MKILLKDLQRERRLTLGSEISMPRYQLCHLVKSEHLFSETLIVISLFHPAFYLCQMSFRSRSLLR